MREFKAMGVEFAFPTRTVHIATVPAPPPAELPVQEPALVPPVAAVPRQASGG